MWIYEYCRFDRSGFLPAGPYKSSEEAFKAMKQHADTFGTRVQGPREIDKLEVQLLIPGLPR
jgi:hypothetical protein